MVHRPSDSRLLVNLLTHEKDYSKQLSTLFERSQASLASFSAFAAASTPPASQVIISVAGALAGADEALKNYAFAVEQWQRQLKALQELEEDVATIMRDREILVSRLIKVSKSQRSSREVTFGPSSSTSTLSFTVKPEVVVGSKLAAAQTELQACEAHLASKERELDVFRIAAIRSGLQLRCQAMVECGWAWGEMGKEGLRSLELFDGPISNGNAPSQSASQVAGYDLPRVQSPSQFRDDNGRPYTLHIPPAHQISELALLNGTTTYLDEEEGGGSSVEDQPTQEVEVHENQRYLPKNKGKYPAHIRASSEIASNRHISFPASTSDSHLIRPSREKKERQRKGSVFSSIAALFHSKSRHVDEDETPPSGKWSTRTDKNLRKARKEDSSDDEGSGFSSFNAPPPPAITPTVPSSPGITSRPSQRLKKKTKRGSVQVRPSSSLATVDERGWASDSGNKSPPRKGKARSPTFSDSGVPDEPTFPATPLATESTTTLKATRKAKPKPKPMLSARLPTEASLSRNSSISKHSTMSAPPLPTTRTTIHPASPSPSRHASVSSSSPGRRRNASLELPSRTPIRTGSLSVTSGKVLSGTGYPINRPKESTQASSAFSANRATAEPEMNLMGIVEGVRHNRVAYEKQQDPNRLLVIAKAPPPVSQNLDLLEFEAGLHDKGKDKELEQGKEKKATEGSISTPSLPVVPNSGATETPPRQPNGHWDKKTVPLRSALRNPSRSPSPSVSPHSSPPHSIAGPSKLRPPLVDTRPAVPRQEGRHEMLKAAQNDADRDDVSSISSYETTHEVFDERGSRTTSPAPKSPESQFPSPPPPPPPPHDEPETQHIPRTTKETSNPQSTPDTQPPLAPRKSVRMSLPPTFSTTPPAIEDDDDPSGAPRGRRPPRSQPPPHSVTKNVAWSSRIHDAQPTKDVWDDSSDEDEEYGHAKRLLSRITRKP